MGDQPLESWSKYTADKHKEKRLPRVKKVFGGKYDSWIVISRIGVTIVAVQYVAGENFETGDYVIIGFG